MVTVLIMNIIPSEKWLPTKYLHTNTVALLFWSDSHTRALGCLFAEEYGEAIDSGHLALLSPSCCLPVASLSLFWHF